MNKQVKSNTGGHKCKIIKSWLSLFILRADLCPRNIKRRIKPSIYLFIQHSVTILCVVQYRQ